MAERSVRAELAAAGFVPVPLPSEIGNLDEAGPVPWMLAAFLAALAVAGLLHAYVTVLRVRRRDVVIGRALGLTTIRRTIGRPVDGVDDDRSRAS